MQGERRTDLPAFPDRHHGAGADQCGERQVASESSHLYQQLEAEPTRCRSDELGLEEPLDGPLMIEGDIEASVREARHDPVQADGLQAGPLQLTPDPAGAFHPVESAALDLPV